MRLALGIAAIAWLAPIAVRADAPTSPDVLADECGPSEPAVAHEVQRPLEARIARLEAQLVTLEARLTTYAGRRANSQPQGDSSITTIPLSSILIPVAPFAIVVCYPESERGDPDQHYSYGGDCAAATEPCASYPSDPTGYCTRTGCLAEPARCAPGWACLDRSAYLAGLPAICTKQ